MKNEEKSIKLQQLKIENDNKKNVDEFKPTENDEEQTMNQTVQDGDGETNEIEYRKLSVELDELQALLGDITERKKNIQLINDQVGGWTSRVA